MSEHPPIPDAAVGAGLHEFTYPRAMVGGPSDAFRRGLAAAVEVLWREWTRGMAVVPLPAPTRPVAQQWTAGEGEAIYWEAHLDADEYGPLVYFQAGERWLGIESTRAFASALLAAADLAEQVDAEGDATGVTP